MVRFHPQAQAAKFQNFRAGQSFKAQLRRFIEKVAPKPSFFLTGLHHHHGRALKFAEN
jgi:hypothetical protein